MGCAEMFFKGVFAVIFLACVCFVLSNVAVTFWMTVGIVCMIIVIILLALNIFK